jgi:glycosyltransferase involved in cell wall biosynthesis
MQQDMKISVIIPTHNRVKLTEEAVRSVLKQKEQADEILLVDDGSSDDTAEIVRITAPAVRILRQQCMGVSAARNSGIRAARHDWLAFLDSDDVWLPGKLRRQKQILKGNPDIKICYTDEIWIKNGRRINQGKKHRKYSGWIYEKCLPLCIISPSSVLLHRSIFDRVGLFDENLPACEDYDLWLRITHLFPVFFLAEKLIQKQAGEWPQLSAQHSLDKYRIIALTKILEDGQLTAENTASTLKELAQKCRIYIQGCKKHQREEEVIWAEEARDNYI